MIRVESPSNVVGSDIDGEELLAAAAADGEVWVRCDDAAAARAVVQRARSVGLGFASVVVEPPVGSIEGLVAEGLVVGYDADRSGGEPGGAWEALLVAALYAGASRVRTVHTRSARRCADVVSALVHERAGS